MTRTFFDTEPFPVARRAVLLGGKGMSKKQQHEVAKGLVDLGFDPSIVVAVTGLSPVITPSESKQHG